ncbi:MAG TPA: response regulator transcription factor [Xanthobacteraceae bacterium]|nr:response regulator transcription factor [Xanthobacteraceae bacterium]
MKSANLNWAVHAFGSVSELTPPRSAPSGSTVIVLCAQGRDGVAVERDIALLSSNAADIPIVVVSDSEDVGHVIAALNCGARGYIPTSVKLNVAVEALRLVAAGGTFVPASCLVPSVPAADTATPAARPPLPSVRLTPRQRAVLEALRLGKANKQIAYELNMREGTVKAHVRDIMKRLRARNRTEVALLASHGRLDSGEP